MGVGLDGSRVTSADGLHWTEAVPGRGEVLRAIAYGEGRFVAVGSRVLSSEDGRSWREWPPNAGEIGTVSFGRGRFVAVAGGALLSCGGRGPFVAGEPLPWAGECRARQSACGDTEAGFRCVTIGEADVPGRGDGLPWRGVTEDGAHWAHTALETSPASGITYGAGIFVVVGPRGLVETSHDGQVWDRREAGTAEDLGSVVWNGTQFLAQGTHLWASEDGISWRALGGEAPPVLLWAGATALGSSPEGRLVYSKDLVHWLPTGAAAPRAIAFRP